MLTGEEKWPLTDILQVPNIDANVSAFYHHSWLTRSYRVHSNIVQHSCRSPSKPADLRGHDMITGVGMREKFCCCWLFNLELNKCVNYRIILPLLAFNSYLKLTVSEGC